MRQDFRKYIAFTLFFIMVIASSASVFAEDQSQNSTEGNGQIEGLVEPDIYQVILPTDVNGTFDFILDPQRLIEETNAAAYGGVDFEKGATVFFRRSDGEIAEVYSSSSDHVKIINRSNIPVDVVVNVSISSESLGGITMTEDREFVNDSSASLYMALTDGENTVPVGDEGAYIRTTIPAAPDEAFEYSYDQEIGEYTYGLKKNLDDIRFPEYSFQLTGAVNENGEWGTVGKAAPLVTVTWDVTPSESVKFEEEENQGQNIASEQNTNLNQISEKDSIGNKIKDRNIDKGTESKDNTSLEGGTKSDVE